MAPQQDTTDALRIDDKSLYGQPHVAETTSSSPTSSSSDLAHSTGTFDKAGLDEYYEPIPEYEGRHRFDPEFTWTPEEERKIVRRLDLRICSWVCLAFFALQLDRGNIVQAVSDNMLPQLGLNTNDYNTGQTIFYVSFLCAELSSQMISKKLGPERWIPIQMVIFSLIACCQAFIQGRGGFFATRCLLGIFEGGFIPDCVLYLTYFYKTNELPVRLSFFWTSYQFTFIVSAFLAFGILHLDGVNGLAGWRWLFALEGTITGLIGIATYFYLPPSPTQTASFFRGKDGWFNEREEKIMVNRVLRDDPSKGSMHNRQAVDFKLLWKCLKDYDMWPIYFLGLVWMIPFSPSTQYLTLIIRSLNFDTFETNLLSIPAYAVFILNLLFWTWLSEHVNDRLLICLAPQLWCIPLLIALETLPGTDAYRWARYVCTTLIVGTPYTHAIVVAMTSRNAGSVRTRTVASAVYNMFVQVSNIIASNIYQNNDKPLYRTGNKVLLGFCAFNICIVLLVKFYYMSTNKKREAIWKSKSHAEKEAYLLLNKDRGNKRLDFRFTH